MNTPRGTSKVARLVPVTPASRGPPTKLEPLSGRARATEPLRTPVSWGLLVVEMVVAVVTIGGFVWVKASVVKTPTVFRTPKFRIRSALLLSVHPPLACPSRGIFLPPVLLTVFGDTFYFTTVQVGTHWVLPSLPVFRKWGVKKIERSLL
jgi:hypothetical protein